jgi:hypothetical protein
MARGRRQDGLVSVDQPPICGSRRSNPARYNRGLLDPIRTGQARVNARPDTTRPPHRVARLSTGAGGPVFARRPHARLSSIDQCARRRRWPRDITSPAFVSPRASGPRQRRTRSARREGRPHLAPSVSVASTVADLALPGTTEQAPAVARSALLPLLHLWIAAARGSLLVSMQLSRARRPGGSTGTLLLRAETVASAERERTLAVDDERSAVETVGSTT